MHDVALLRFENSVIYTEESVVGLEKRCIHAIDGD